MQDPLCACEGEGVWDGLHAFFEAKETDEFVDMAFNWDPGKIEYDICMTGEMNR